jgi:hypothetical protein
MTIRRILPCEKANKRRLVWRGWRCWKLWNILEDFVRTSTAAIIPRLQCGLYHHAIGILRGVVIASRAPRSAILSILCVSQPSATATQHHRQCCAVLVPLLQLSRTLFQH